MVNEAPFQTHTAPALLDALEPTATVEVEAPLTEPTLAPVIAPVETREVTARSSKLDVPPRVTSFGII